MQSVLRGHILFWNAADAQKKATAARLREFGSGSAVGSARAERRGKIVVNMGARSSKAMNANNAGEIHPSSRSENGAKISGSGFDLEMSPEEIESAKKDLTKFQRYVTFEKGTERAFSGETVNGYKHDNKEKGVYVSAVSGLPLFTSDSKFDSGTGWPSFDKPYDPEHVKKNIDFSIPFMPRTEVVDAKSGAHLGHVFGDGPTGTGERYCINAAALKFIPMKEWKKQLEERSQSQSVSE